MYKTQNSVSHRRRPAFTPGTQLCILSVILIIIIVLTLWNTSNLRSVLNYSTENYAKDVTCQLADDITARLESNQQNMILLADSISKIDYSTGTEALKEFLNRKAEILDFDILIFIDSRGNTIPSVSDAQDLWQLPSVQESLQGNTEVAYIEGQSLLYSTPVYSGSEIIGVLTGIHRKENIQSLIQPKAFSGESLTCIIDNSGKVVVSPTELKPFLQLDDIFKSGKDRNTENEIVKMMDNMKSNRDGVFPFTAVNGDELIMSYHPLNVNQWVLLTLIPADLISYGANVYTVKTFLIIGGIAVVFILFLASILRFYSYHRKHLEQLAFSDPVTGGMNYSAFQLQYEELVKAAPPLTYTLIMLNVKGFKLINENYGTAAGNDTLRYIYKILLRHTEPGEFAARSEADNFFLCIKEREKQAIQFRLDAMIHDINSFNKTRETPYYLTILQGAYLIDDPTLELTIIQDRTRTAYQNQASGAHPSCAFYDADFTRQLQTEQELNDLFEQSLKNHDFQVYLQPKVRLLDGGIAGAEALVRWIHPQKGIIFPSDFIPIFERNGKICRLDLYMFEEVCRLLQQWNQKGQPWLPVSVNLSRQHFKNPEFLKSFSEIAGRYHVPQNTIEFELTESILLDPQQIEIVKKSIHKMHCLGFLCSLDDFGSGFSSLGLLKEFDVDTIKLDRQFFLDISKEKSRDVIACLIELAKKLNVRTVAEGIEVQEQLDYLRDIGCDMVQGYIFSRPLPSKEFEAFCAV